MDGLKNLSFILMAPAGIMLVWDLIEHWFVKNMIKVRTFKEWGTKLFSTETWSSIHNMLMKMGAFGNKLEAWPGFMVFFVPGITLYLLYRIAFLLGGGKTGGYKSRY